MNFVGVNLAHSTPLTKKLALHFQAALQCRTVPASAAPVPSRSRKGDCGKVRDMSAQDAKPTTLRARSKSQLLLCLY